MKKLISGIIIFVLITQLLFQNALAIESNQNIKFPTSNYIQTLTSGMDWDTVDSLFGLRTCIRDFLNNRKSNFTIIYIGDLPNTDTSVGEILKDIFDADDYLAYSYVKKTCIFEKHSIFGETFEITFKFALEYRGTPDENYVNTTCQTIINSNTSPNDSDATKVGKIHDYLVKYLKYDESMTYYDAASALKNKTTTCQGYTLLMHKMMTMMGIKCRIISNDKDHIWNLVYINEAWYHVDATWDDPLPDVEGRVVRTCFMVSDNFMKDDTHIWDESKYPKADAPPIVENPQQTPFIPTDISCHWGREYIEELVEAGVINGYADGTFKADNTITRAEFCKIVVGALVKQKGYYFSSNTKSFTDVSPDDWFSKYVETAVAMNFAGGVGDGSFNPKAPLTRQEMAKILSRVYIMVNNSTIESIISGVNLDDYGFTDISSADPWAIDYLKVVLKTGLMKGDAGLFNPKGQVTRAQTATVISRILGMQG